LERERERERLKQLERVDMGEGFGCPLIKNGKERESEVMISSEIITENFHGRTNGLLNH
jgi:hypothetical protein